MAKESCQKTCQHIYDFRTFEPAKDFNRDGINSQQEPLAVVNKRKYLLRCSKSI